MRVHGAVDVSGFTRFASRKHPLWWGIVGVVTIEATVVATLIVSYFYLGFNAEAWPPAGVAPPDLLWPTVNLVLLLASAGTMYWAGRGIDRNNQTVLVLGTGASVVLASTTLVFRSLKLDKFDFSWDSHPYGSIVWTITGFHYTHVMSAIVGTAAVTLLAWRGYFTKQRQLGVVVDTVYWYFVAGVWVPFYVVIYLTPRFL